LGVISHGDTTISTSPSTLICVCQDFTSARETDDYHRRRNSRDAISHCKFFGYEIVHVQTYFVADYRPVDENNSVENLFALNFDIS
jgi:hypothetical protein